MQTLFETFRALLKNTYHFVGLVITPVKMEPLCGTPDYECGDSNETLTALLNKYLIDYYFSWSILSISIIGQFTGIRIYYILVDSSPAR
jgi:hypothetical protein